MHVSIVWVTLIIIMGMGARIRMSRKAILLSEA